MFRFINACCLWAERLFANKIYFVSYLSYLIFMPGPEAGLDARPTGIQEVAGSILRSGNILSWRLVMKSFLRSFSHYR